MNPEDLTDADGQPFPDLDSTKGFWFQDAAWENLFPAEYLAIRREILAEALKLAKESAAE